MGVFKPLGERRRLLIFQLGEREYLLFGEDECGSSNLSLSGQQQNTKRLSHAMKMMAGKVLRLNVVCTLSPPKHRGSQTVLCGEIWPENITDWQSCEGTGQRRDPGSILMVAPGGCWVLIRASAGNILIPMVMPALSLLHQQHLPHHLSSVSWRRACSKVRSR